MLAEREKAIRAADDIARNELGDMYELAKMADTVTVACLMEDLAVEERLDAAIDKCLKRLLLVRDLNRSRLRHLQHLRIGLPGPRKLPRRLIPLKVVIMGYEAAKVMGPCQGRPEAPAT